MRTGTSFDLFVNFVLLPLAALVIFIFAVHDRKRAPDVEPRKVKNILLVLLSAAALLLLLLSCTGLLGARWAFCIVPVLLIHLFNAWEVRRKPAGAAPGMWKVTYVLCIVMLLVIVCGLLSCL